MHGSDIYIYIYIYMYRGTLRILCGATAPRPCGLEFLVFLDFLGLPYVLDSHESMALLDVILKHVFHVWMTTETRNERSEMKSDT